jgi:hypothetical protein
VLELAFGRRFHPVSTAIAASLFVLAGLTLLLTMHPAVIAAALVLYEAGNGVKTIVKGTLPLALLGSSGYASLLGRLAMPMLLAQAVAPGPPFPSPSTRNNWKNIVRVGPRSMGLRC